MKQNIYKILFTIVGCYLFTACNEDYTELDKGHDVLTITANITDIRLEESNYASDALELTWSTGTNYGTGNKISYLLEIDKAGNNFTNPHTIDMGNGTYSWTRSVEQLNTLLIEQVGVSAGTTADIEARVTATVTGLEQAVKQQAGTSFKVTTYQPVTKTLYLIGDATSTGWNADEPTQMERTSPGIFTWTGQLTSEGGFKFITTKGEFLPSYNKDISKGELTLVYRTSKNDPDETFSVDESGSYTITANLLTMSLGITEADENASRFNDLFFVGSFTDWNFVAMTPDPLRSNLFHYAEVFEWNGGGEFKFGTQQDWDDMFYAGYANASYTSKEVVFNSTDDNKWLLREEECGKAYKIMLDITKDKEQMIMKPFTPYTQLYLVGDASPSGWDIENATAMNPTESPYIFTWTGRLESGELKISCDKQSDWMGAWFMPVKNGIEPSPEESILFIDKSDEEFKGLYPELNINDVDMKWKIDNAGTYTITINQLKNTLSINN